MYLYNIYLHNIYSRTVIKIIVILWSSQILMYIIMKVYNWQFTYMRCRFYELWGSGVHHSGSQWERAERRGDAFPVVCGFWLLQAERQYYNIILLYYTGCISYRSAVRSGASPIVPRPVRLVIYDGKWQ